MKQNFAMRSLLTTGLLLSGSFLFAQQSSDFTFRNQTSLQIAYHVVDNTVKMKVKNLAAKTLRSYVVGCGEQSVMPEFLPPMSNGVPPGESREFSFNVPNKSGGEGAAPVPCTALQMYAALYEDGSSEGDPQRIAAMKTMGLARIIQLRRIIPILEQVSNASVNTSDQIQAVQTAADQIAALPLTLNDGSTAEGLVANGVQQSKSEVVVLLKDIARSASESLARGGNPDLRKPLLELKQSRETMLRSLEAELLGQS